MGEEREASSAVSADGGPESDSKTCERCGSAIDTSEWYPVTADRDDDGSLELYHFCSEDCQSAWLEERSG